MSTVAELDQVTKVFRVRGQRAHHVAVDHVSFKVEAGETLGIVGESGSGKTTIARMLLRLTRPTSGHVSITGMEIWAAGRQACASGCRERSRWSSRIRTPRSTRG